MQGGPSGQMVEFGWLHVWFGLFHFLPYSAQAVVIMAEYSREGGKDPRKLLIRFNPAQLSDHVVLRVIQNRVEWNMHTQQYGSESVVSGLSFSLAAPLPPRSDERDLKKIKSVASDSSHLICIMWRRGKYRRLCHAIFYAKGTTCSQYNSKTFNGTV